MVDDTTQLLKDKRVLLIESDEVNQMLIGYMIEDQGGILTLRTRQSEVLNDVRQQNADLIILDTALDGVNALEFTQMLRKEMDVQVPIIGLSTYDLKGRGVYSGLDAVLQKPIEYPALKEMLAKIMS